jgi:hypothetical protein
MKCSGAYRTPRKLTEISTKMAVMIITRTPEIIAVFKITDIITHTYIIFNPRLHKLHPKGPAFIFNTSMEATAEYLSDLFRFDINISDDESLRWQAKLLAHFSARYYTASNKLSDPEARLEAVLDSSLAVLALQAEVASLDARIQSLEVENQRFKTENYRLECAKDDAEIRYGHCLGNKSQKLNHNPGWQLEACCVSMSYQHVQHLE